MSVINKLSIRAIEFPESNKEEQDVVLVLIFINIASFIIYQ